MENYIKSTCGKCGKEEDVRLSDILSGKSPKTGFPNGWQMYGDYIDYHPSFLLCMTCKSLWMEHLQGEIEKFVKP